MRKITQPIKKNLKFLKKNLKKLDKSHNLFKFVLVLLSPSVERVGVSRMQDFFLCGNHYYVLFITLHAKTESLAHVQPLLSTYLAQVSLLKITDIFKMTLKIQEFFSPQKKNHIFSERSDLFEMDRIFGKRLNLSANILDILLLTETSGRKVTRDTYSMFDVDSLPDVSQKLSLKVKKSPTEGILYHE